MKKLLCFALLFLPALAFGQGNHVTGSLVAQSTDCSVANSCAVLSIGANVGAVGIQLSGTFSGTVQFEGTASGTWVAVQGTPSAGGTSVTSATATGIWIVPVAGLTVVRVRVSTYSSGSVGVDIQDSGGSLTASAGSLNYVTVAGDGSTNDSSAIQTAINGQTTNGGRVDLPPNKIIAFASTITLKTGVTLYLNGSTLKWTGSNSGTLFNTDSTVVAARTGIDGQNGIIDMNACATCTAFAFHSMQWSTFQDFSVVGPASQTNKIITMTADSSTSTGSIDGSKNLAWLLFRNIYSWTPKAFDSMIPGTSTGITIDGSTNYASLLWFDNVNLWGVINKCVDIVKNTDTVFFNGNYCDVETSGGIGYELDSAEGGSQAVNAITIRDSVITGNIAVGGRTGLKLHRSVSVHTDSLNIDRVETIFNLGTATNYYLCGETNNENYNCVEDGINHHGSKIPLVDSNVDLQIGNPTAANAPTIQFVTSGHPGNFDSLFLAEGGSASAANGVIHAMAAEFRYRSPASVDDITINYTGIQGLVSGLNLNGFDDIRPNNSLTVGSGGPTITAGSGVPSANCGVGSIYLRSGAPSASTALYVCAPANTWTAVTVP